MSTKTPILQLNQPRVGADRNAWGSLLNENFGVLDTLVSLNRKRDWVWELPVYPGGPLTLQLLGREKLLTAGATFVGVIPVVVTAGISQIHVDLKTGTDFIGTLTFTGTSRHKATGLLTVADSEVVATDIAGRYTSQKVWVGTVTITPASLTITAADIYATSLFQNAGQPFEIEAFRLLAASTSAGKTLAMAFRTFRRAETGVSLVVEEVLGGKLDVGATPAGSHKWDLTLEPGLDVLTSDTGEGLIADMTLTGATAGDWLDLQFQMQYKVRPNS